MARKMQKRLKMINDQHLLLSRMEKLIVTHVERLCGRSEDRTQYLLA
jgi:hypothetical protein